MENEFKYDVFLSFASKDRELVKPIYQELSILGLRVFWSDEVLKKYIGQSFFEIIQDALIRSKHFILFCSHNSMNSAWVKQEYEVFFSECYIKSNRERFIFLMPDKNFNKSSLPSLFKNIQLCTDVKDILNKFNLSSIDLTKNKGTELNISNQHQQKEKKLIDELCDTYLNVKAVVLFAEVYDEAFKSNLQIAKQFRDAFDHLMIVLNDKNNKVGSFSEKYRISNLEHSIEHLFRAATDALEGSILSLKVRIVSLLDDYSQSTLVKIIPNYHNDTKKIISITNKISKYRESKYNRNGINAIINNYLEDLLIIKNYYEKILKFIPQLESAQRNKRSFMKKVFSK